jgi:superfamily II DNA or RNA helicase
VQVCSIDTLIARNLFPEMRFVVVDEAHMATSPSYQRFVEQYPKAYMLAVTATPYCEKPLTHLADAVIKPISMRELIAQNFLVDFEYYCPKVLDLTGVRINSATKDYNVKELEDVLEGSSIYGSAVKHYERLSHNEPSIAFCISVRHSKILRDAFARAGISAAHIDAKTPDDERKRLLQLHSKGEIKVLTNVGVLCTGIDLPYLRSIIMCRPTKSYNLFVQQAGRGTRIFPGKEKCVLIDHAANVLRHGFPTDEPNPIINGKNTVHRMGTIPKICLDCYAVHTSSRCPFCGGANRQLSEKQVIQIDGKLARTTDFPIEVQRQMCFKRLKEEQKTRGYKRGWLWHQMKNKYGEDIANEYVPKRKLPYWIKAKYKSA